MISELENEHIVKSRMSSLMLSSIKPNILFIRNYACIHVESQETQIICISALEPACELKQVL